VPDAAAVKVAVAPAVTVTFAGLVVIAGAVLFAAFTVKVAAVVVALPDAFVKTALYWLPLAATVVPTTLNIGEVAPTTLANVPPPLVLNCH